MNQPDEMNVHEVSSEEEQFERDLRLAMRRVDAPAGFAERTMARAAARPRAKVIVMRPRFRVWMSGAVAAALLGGVFAGEQMRVRHERQEAEAAQRQFEAGMRITDEALEQTRQQLAQAGVRFGE